MTVDVMRIVTYTRTRSPDLPREGRICFKCAVETALKGDDVETVVLIPNGTDGILICDRCGSPAS